MPANHVGENLEERRHRRDSEEDGDIVRVRREEIEEGYYRCSPHTDTPRAREEVRHGSTRTELWLLEGVALPYFLEVIELFPEELRDSVVDEESNHPPGSERDKDEVDKGQFGVRDTGFGLEDDSPHDDKEHEKNAEDNIPKVLICNTYHKDLHLHPHAHHQNKDEGTRHHRHKTKQEFIEGLVEHLVQYTVLLSHFVSKCLDYLPRFFFQSQYSNTLTNITVAMIKNMPQKRTTSTFPYAGILLLPVVMYVMYTDKGKPQENMYLNQFLKYLDGISSNPNKRIPRYKLPREMGLRTLFRKSYEHSPAIQ